MIIQKGKRPQEICINPACKSKVHAGQKEEVQEIKEHHLEKKCPKCGKILVLRKSFYGQFLGCPGYPNCKYAENLGEKKEEKK